MQTVRKGYQQTILSRQIHLRVLRDSFSPVNALKPGLCPLTPIQSAYSIKCLRYATGIDLILQRILKTLQTITKVARSML